MSGENMQDPQDFDADAAPEAPASDSPQEPQPFLGMPPGAPMAEPFAAPEPMPASDAEAVVEDFEVPPPPAFGDVPPPPAIPDPVIPPAPADDSALDALFGSDAFQGSARAGVAATAEEKAATRAAASRAATARDEAARRDIVTPSEGGTEGTYRGWKITIFTGLGILLIGAIIAIVYLATSAPLS